MGARLKPQILFRKIHHWGSIFVALPLMLMIGAGIFLMLKKEITWIQPQTIEGSQTGVPVLSVAQMFEAAKLAPEADFTSWDDLDRLDFKPGKGVAKFVGHNNWEVQVDTHTGELLQVSFRRSDIIESLHDGSFFSDDIKLYLFLPAGIGLFILWCTGLYLFFLPHLKNRQKHKKNQRKNQTNQQEKIQKTTADASVKGAQQPAE